MRHRIEFALRLWTIIATGLLLGASAACDSSATINQHRRVSLPAGPPWAITSGAWITRDDRDALLVVDRWSEKLLVFAEDGSLDDPPLPLIPSAVPWTVHSNLEKGHLVYSRMPGGLDWFHQLDSDLRQEVAHVITDRRFGDTTVVAIYDWIPMGAGILAYAEIKGLDFAFLYLDLEGRGQVFHRLSRAAVVNDHYTRHEGYLAAIGDTGYILLLDQDQPAIGEVRLGRDGVRRLRSFPPEYGDLPPPEREPDLYPPFREAVNLYRRDEASNMAMGVYSHGETLYLLAKDAIDGDGETAWWLYRVDPRDSKAPPDLLRARLPTTAAHLTVIPGERWVIFERQAVTAHGALQYPTRLTTSMVLIDGSWFDLMNNPSPWMATSSERGLLQTAPPR